MYTTSSMTSGKTVSGCSPATMVQNAEFSAPRAISRMSMWSYRATSKPDPQRLCQPATRSTFSSDTPLETNHVYRLDRRGNPAKVAALSSSSIYGCNVGNAVFFSTMVEPSPINSDRTVCLYGSPDGI